MVQWIKFILYIFIFSGSLLFTQVELTINAIPHQAEVFMDGTSIGQTPITRKQIISGPHDFELTKKGYASVNYSLIVNPSKEVKLDFYLNPIYKIKFTTKEKGLTFELNKKHKWDKNKIRLELEAGEHLLRVYKNNKIVDEQTILSDQPKHFKYFLKKKLSE